MLNISGSCLCGAVTYRSSEQPVVTAFCHCRNCQKGGGAAYSANVAVPTTSVAIDGPIKRYSTQGGSGSRLTRSFCSTCGSPIAIEVEALAGLMLLQAGTLDDASAVEPNVHIWCASAQPWDSIPEGCTRYDKSPPASA